MLELDNELKETIVKNYQENTSFKNLIIFDADGLWNTENWNLDSKKKVLEEIKKEKGLEFEAFFMPNNIIEGDFETLLESLVNMKNSGNKKIIECHISFEACRKEIIGYEIPDRKDRMYSYISSHKKSKNENEMMKNKGNWFFDNTEYWDFESKSLDPLKEILKLHLK